MKPILVVADLVESRDQKAEIRPVIQEVLAWAEQIQDLLQEPGDSKEVLPEIQILVPAHLPLTAAEKLAEQTGIKTIALSFPDLVTPESLKQGLAHIADQIRPCWILFAHTTMGREVAPGLAARLNASAISGATGVGADPAGLFFFRPVMDNGRIQKVRPCNAALGVLTLVPGAMAAKSRTLNIQGNLDPQDALAREGPLETPGKEALSRKNKFFCPVVEMKVPLTCLSQTVKRKSVTRPKAGSPALKSARIVLGAGQGVGEQENLAQIFEFAKALPGASVGASRPLVDKGWMDYPFQVGITGTCVAPDLYIACGISGSSQHLAGMSQSKWVVSINKNPDAPISRHSDLFIQADLIEFIRCFLDKK